MQKARIGWVAAGWVMMALALVGLVLPVVPQVPFAIAAAWCFSKGSPRLHRWITHHPKLGPPVRDWEEHGVVRPKLKILSVVMMTGGAVLGFWRLREDYFAWAVALDVAFLASIVFVATRPSAPRPSRGANGHS